MLIAITNCRSMKQDYTCSAEEIYNKSYVFRAQKDFFKIAYDKYLILSSEYGIIEPTQIIQPYESIHLSQISRVKTKGDWSSEKLEKWINDAVQKINYYLDMGNEIHFYITTPYWNLLKKHFKNNPKVRHITQQRNNPVGQRKYNEAVEMFSLNKNELLEKCISHVSTLDKGTPETAKWFYHPNEEPFFGKCHHLAKKYEWADEGALHRVSLGKNPHHKGWVINEDTLFQLYKTDSGQWRIRK